MDQYISEPPKYTECEFSLKDALSIFTKPTSKLETVRYNNLRKVCDGVNMTVSKFPKCLVDDSDFFRYAIDEQPTIYRFASKRIQLDWNIAFRVAVKSGFDELHPRFREHITHDFVFEVIHWVERECSRDDVDPMAKSNKWYVIKSIPAWILADLSFMHRMLNECPDATIYGNSQLRTHPKLARAAVSVGLTGGYEESNLFYDDIHLSVHAMKHRPELFENFSPEIRADNDVAVAAISLDFENFRFVGPDLQNNYGIADQAIQGYEKAPDYRHYMMHISPKFAECLSTALRERFDLMERMCRLDGNNIEFANTQLQDDMDLVSISCKSRNGAFKFASLRLKDHEEFIKKLLSAGKGDDDRYHDFVSVVAFASDRLKDDWDFCQQCLVLQKDIFQHFSERLKNNFDFIAECFEIDPLVCENLPYTVRKKLNGKDPAQFFKSYSLEKKLKIELVDNTTIAPKKTMKI